MSSPMFPREDLYRNRDIDWLNFNGRVLQEAGDPSNPLFERIKFLAIFSSNLDEFFRVRVSKLRQIGKVDRALRQPLALKPNKTVKEILKRVHQQQEEFGRVFREQIKPELARHGILLLELPEYSEEQKTFLIRFFESEIRPFLNILESSTCAVEDFVDGALYVAVEFAPAEAFAFLSVGKNQWGRFVELPSDGKTSAYVFLEDIIKLNAHLVFQGKEIKGLFSIKLSRDAALYLEDEYEGDWIPKFYEALAERQKGQPTRLLYEGTMPRDTQKRIRKFLGLGKVDMVQGGVHHNYSDFFGFPFPPDKTACFYEPREPLPHPDFEASTDFFELVREKDRILHFPYQRFGYLETWLTRAAADEAVERIQISLYRIARNSQLTSALLQALDRGIEVTIFVEAKARFDEENNLGWGKIFEEKGAQVYYSFPKVKVHSKILLIERREGNRLRGYAYIGTGNFNAKTAKIYCDHGLFTANTAIAEDLAQVFEVLKRQIETPRLSSLLVSPFTCRARFEALVLREIGNASKKLPARITIKMNSLEDPRMIDLLYRASAAGVEVNLLIRGFCSLIPGVKGLSENIRVMSIVDRYLEHARVFLFHNGGSEKLFMGSADWMIRNLDKRIEVIAPILDTAVFEELKHLLELQMADNVKARIVDPVGSNAYVLPRKGEPGVQSQDAIYQYLKSLKLRRG